MLKSSLLTVWLTLGPPQEPTDLVLLDLEHATSTVGEVAPATSAELLERSIAAASQHPRALLDNPRLADRVFHARVALVWAYLASDDRARATAAMDEVVQSASGRPLAPGFGPDVEALHAERLSAARERGTAELVVQCHAPCQVLLNEVRVGDWAGVQQTLPLGTYRVWVVAVGDHSEPRYEPRYEEVELDSDGERIELSFGTRRVAERQVERDLGAHARLSPEQVRWQNRRKKATGGVLLGLGLLVATGAFVSTGYYVMWTQAGDVVGQFVSGTLAAAGFVNAFGLLIPGALVLNSVEHVGTVKVRAGPPIVSVSPHAVGVGWTVRF